ncbi:retropepsin-like domain-containing protein [Candidatus Curtissbacteria bacterium]|nr:retropepsin-like domain-containing protein [Candidatus Curtissbacteria bacterium]
MIFPYRQVTSKIARPVIPLILKNKGKFALYAGLIDSGADYCIFNIQIAKELNISLGSKKHSLKGIGREKVVGFLGEFEIGIDGTTYNLTAVFAKMEELGHGILGQIGFFDHFDVRLNYRERTIEIKKLPEIN